MAEKGVFPLHILRVFAQVIIHGVDSPWLDFIRSNYMPKFKTYFILQCQNISIGIQIQKYFRKIKLKVIMTAHYINMIKVLCFWFFFYFLLGLEHYLWYGVLFSFFIMWWTLNIYDLKFCFFKFKLGVEHEHWFLL